MPTPTLDWIANGQIDIAQDELHLAKDAIAIGDTHQACEVLTNAIRQLEAARRHLA